MTAKNCLQILTDNEARAQISREYRSTIENSRVMRLTPSSSTNSTSILAKSTCACSPAGVSKRTSKPVGREGRSSRTPSRTTLQPPAKPRSLNSRHSREGGIGSQSFAQIGFEAVPGSAYLLTPPFGMECLTSLADDIT
jgi:hypothetical protein